MNSINKYVVRYIHRIARVHKIVDRYSDSVRRNAIRFAVLIYILLKQHHTGQWKMLNSCLFII